MNYLILLGAIVALFYKAFYCGYVVDDIHMATKMIENKKNLKEGKMKFIKFLKECCYGAGFFKNAYQEYAFNISLHYINCCLIYHMSHSLIASLLYLCNPINNQTVLWMNGRRYALSILSVLLIWNWHILALVLFPAIAWLHVSGLACLALFLYTPYWPLIPLAVIPMFFVFKQTWWETFKSRKNEFKAGNENQNFTWKKLILYVKSVGYNFVNCIFPVKPAMYHNFLFYFSNDPENTEQGYSFNYDFYKGLLVIGFLGYMIVAQHSFWAFWFLLFISPWCNLYQVTMNASDRYCSLANVGAMILLAELITHLPGQYQFPVIFSFIIFYCLKYQPLFRGYTTIENFYLYHLYQQPDLVNPRYYLGKHYLDNNDIYSAFATIKVGLKYRPYDFKFLLAMMEILFQLGKIESGLKVMGVAEKCLPPLEIEDGKVFFDTLRIKFKRNIDEIAMRDSLRAKNRHNNGQPIVK